MTVITDPSGHVCVAGGGAGGGSGGGGGGGAAVEPPNEPRAMNENLRSWMKSVRGPNIPDGVNCCNVFVTVLVKFCAWTPILSAGLIV